MNTSQSTVSQDSPEKVVRRPLLERMTIRGYTLAALGLIAVTAGAVSVVEYRGHQNAERNRLVFNRDVLTGKVGVEGQPGIRTLHGDLTLANGVNLRKAPVIKNDGDPDLDQISNIAHTMRPNDSSHTVSHAIMLTARDGKLWAAVEKPGTKPNTLEQKANDLTFVALEELASTQGETVTIAGYTPRATEVGFNPPLDTVEMVPGLHGGVGYEAGKDDALLTVATFK